MEFLLMTNISQGEIIFSGEMKAQRIVYKEIL
jgi:hypothetical protein